MIRPEQQVGVGKPAQPEQRHPATGRRSQSARRSASAAPCPRCAPPPPRSPTSGNTAIRRENPPPTMINLRSVPPGGGCATARPPAPCPPASARPKGPEARKQCSPRAQRLDSGDDVGGRPKRGDRHRSNGKWSHEHHAVLTGDRVNVLIGTKEVFKFWPPQQRVSPLRGDLLPKGVTQSRQAADSDLVLFSSPNPIDPDEPLTRFLEMLPPLPTAVTRSTLRWVPPRASRRPSIAAA